MTDLRLVTPGVGIFSDPPARRKVDDPVGGILIAAYYWEDPETGAVDLRYRAWDRFRMNGRGMAQGGYVTLDRDQCGPDSVSRMDRSDVTKVTSQMAQQYVERRGSSGRKHVERWDIDLIHDLWTLMKVLEGE